MRNFWAIILVVLSLSPLQAEEAAPVDLKNPPISGPYCGVYSLSACLQSFDKKPPLEDLLKPEYIGSDRGSSAAELMKAARDKGFETRCYGSLTWRQLKEMRNPAILHFRGNSDQSFNHWVAFLGVGNGRVRILDAPHELALITPAELLASWDGTAILVSDQPIFNTVLWTSTLDYLAFVCVLIGLALLIKSSVQKESATAFEGKLRSRVLYGQLGLQVLSIIGIAAIFAVVYHSISEIGFFRNATALAEVTRRYHNADFPDIPLAKMEQIVADESVYLFDARYTDDFQMGTLPRATNLAIDSSLAERQKILQDVPKEARVVVFCQSSGCRYADILASFMKFNGYQNISLFRGGYREWSNHQKEKHP